MGAATLGLVVVVGVLGIHADAAHAHAATDQHPLLENIGLPSSHSHAADSALLLPASHLNTHSLARSHVLSCRVPPASRDQDAGALTYILDNLDVDVWAFHHSESPSIDIAVSDDPELHKIIAEFFECDTLVPSIARLVQEEAREMEAVAAVTHAKLVPLRLLTPSAPTGAREHAAAELTGAESKHNHGGRKTAREAASSDPDAASSSYEASFAASHPFLSLLSTVTSPTSSFFDTYHPYDLNVAFLRALSLSRPDLVSAVEVVGQTVEKRELVAVRVTGPTQEGGGGGGKDVVVLTAGIHAREWISSSSLLYIAARLVDEYTTDPSTARILDAVEFVLIPSINPDGYEYSRNSDRMWRKNRRRNDAFSHGVDLNRNFDDHWGDPGASPNPFSETYRGPSAASEPETKAVQDYLLGIARGSKGRAPRKIIAGVDLHSYGQDILRSWGWTHRDSTNEAVLAALGDRAAKAATDVPRITEKEGKGAKYASFKASGLYVTSGSTDDWYTSHLNATGWTVELRDKGNKGFVLPPSLIVPTGIDAYAICKALVEGILEIPGGIPPNH
ncbi:hypothetical protein M427DRAFT_136528 [Gonapodya prolifera JEL478]|uniref:Peptidase M14 domain-containing protein n=1 Tax=Gonapodya prolifera (strain JEL478) TaxID=1344416 RepID=A0A139A9Y1_GONPJ|nr:hypothetical protein M427DRAFT_136528 [Gonapodya prolifera JEL478]|eukprot:KXS13540.1 hypothetical protein M427DRAFT_136528 [Gonapodya prolifera JEL478]